ncbi:uncharacterized protein E6C27_scaffold403G001300 [Cucumis melo var. makuwa]|uniref:Asp_protease_2 domain-containing protein n=1 Tax=Cucumis melo var. makuwa TaxID=1194695 RepID=A0A5A7SXR3_CUCMM|nr:uncharacterized protein E6C27_scaffold403G001300 [Cucumis melo var. makuwa]
MVDSSATHNFITEAEARRLRLRWEKDLGRMKAVNSVALPIVGLVKQTMIKFGGWKCHVDFVVVKMDDFDVVLGIEFLLEHQVIPMPSTKCLVITGSFPIVVQEDIRQPNGFKMLSAIKLDKIPTHEEPLSTTILLGALGKLGETVPKDTLCVSEKCHGMMPNSWPKSLSMRRRTDHGIESPSKVKAPANNAYRTMPLELAVLQKQSKKLLEEDIQWGGNVECQAAFNGLKQATIEGSSLGVVDATKPPKVKAEQFNCMVKEYLHHFVDGRQKNWVQLLNVAQFGHSAQIDLLIKRNLFEIKGSRHYVLSLLIDGPYVGNNPQVHIVEKEWEQMADIARVCLEEASRSMEERVDQKRCSIELEWMAKLSINGATTSYDYLSTWNRKKIEESKKSLLIE